MIAGRRSVAHSLASIGRRLVALAVLFAFVSASVIHLSHADFSGPAVVAAADDGGDEPAASAMDHCHCVAAAPWLDQGIFLRRPALRPVPMHAVLDLATRHPENDARPPKA